jgi:hypothetical protein
MWFVIWLMLLAGSVAAGFFLGRDLYRKGAALVRDISELATVADRLEQRAEELRKLQEPYVGPPHPLTLTDEDLQELRTGRKQRIMARRKRKKERNQATYARWESYFR